MREKLLNNIDLLRSIKHTKKDGQTVYKKQFCKSKGEETTSEKSDVVNLKLMSEVGK